MIDTAAHADFTTIRTAGFNTGRAIAIDLESGRELVVLTATTPDRHQRWTVQGPADDEYAVVVELARQVGVELVE